jgi:hypothetical protein
MEEVVDNKEGVSKQKLEEYKAKVNQFVTNLEEYICDKEGMVKPGAIDAVGRVMQNLLMIHIEKSPEPKELVEGQITSTIGNLAASCSNTFFHKFSKTLFNMEPPEL